MIGLSVVLAALLAGANPSPEDQLRAAEQAYDDGDFDKALGLLQIEEGPLLARARLLRGQCFSAKGDTAQAKQAFTGALEADPEVRLDEDRVSPQVVRAFEELRRSLRPRERAKVDEIPALEASPPRSGRRTAGFVLGGAGAAAVVVGAVFDALGAQDFSRASSLAKTANPSDRPAFDYAASSFHWKRTAAVTCYVAGGIVLAGGLAWTLWPVSSAPPVKVSVAPTAGGAAFSVSGRWP